MTDFDERLKKAIDRGHRTRQAEGAAAGEKQATEEDLRNLHSKLRIAVSEHIEACLKKLCDHFPGFEYSTVMSSEGWGAKISRDDINIIQRRSSNLYSRLEMLVKPFTETHILEISTKGTIRNKEALNRSQYRFLNEANESELIEIVDNVVVSFAELYSARG